MIALGLMSGTSMDGIDVALIETDGETRVRPIAALTRPYEAPFRAALQGVLGGTGDVDAVETALTAAHAEAVEALLHSARLAAGQVAVIGFHGHTILHAPRQGRTWQIGDGAWLARRCGIDVVADFRKADIAAGGEGAPLAPLYHAALAAHLEKPLAVLNVGGVANLTWIGAGAPLIAFDTGPGNALIDDWALRHTGRPVDAGGALAAAGRVDEARLAGWLAHGYFSRNPPKSLDRLDFASLDMGSLSPADGAATLTAFTAAAVAIAVKFLPLPPRRWLVGGGGRHNPTLMAALASRLGGAVAPVEAAGWDGDALEAQAFAYLAVRSLKGLPLSEPGTTGARRAVTGGRLFRAAS